MAGHARYPALDADRIASQSPAIIDGLLRDELGFDGVVITDSTEAAAVQAVTGVQEAAVRNVRAGWTSCSPRAAAPTSRSTARCWPRRAATRASATGSANRPGASWRSQRSLSADAWA